MRGVWKGYDNGYRDPGWAGRSCAPREPSACTCGTSSRRPGELLGSGRRDRRRRVHELLLVAAVQPLAGLISSTTVGGAGGAAIYGVTRPKRTTPGRAGMSGAVEPPSPCAVVALLAAGCGASADGAVGDLVTDVPGRRPDAHRRPAPNGAASALRRHPLSDQLEETTAERVPPCAPPVCSPIERALSDATWPPRSTSASRPCGARTCRSTIRSATSPSPSRSRPRPVDRPRGRRRGRERGLRRRLPGAARIGAGAFEPAGSGKTGLGGGTDHSPSTSAASHTRSPRLPRGLDRSGHPRADQRPHRRVAGSSSSTGLRPDGLRHGPDRARATGSGVAGVVLRVSRRGYRDRRLNRRGWRPAPPCPPARSSPRHPRPSLPSPGARVASDDRLPVGGLRPYRP